MSHRNDNIQYKVIVAAATSLGIANTAVALRILARRLTRICFQTDDYLIIAALVFQWGIAMATIVLLHHGLGRHIETVSREDLKVYMMTLYTGSFLYAGTIAFTKFSVLWLYYRVFRTPYMSHSCVAVAAIVLSWAIATSFVGAFLCDPVDKVWDPKAPGTCIDLISFYFGLQIPNVLTDIVLLLMPVKIILNLPLSKSQKIFLLGIFGVGGLTLIFDVIRLVVLIQLRNGNGDITFDQVNASIWTCVEPAVAILAACLPHMRPLDRLVKGRQTSFTSFDSEAQVNSPNEAASPEPLGAELEQVKSDDSEIIEVPKTAALVL